MGTSAGLERVSEKSKYSPTFYHFFFYLLGLYASFESHTHLKINVVITASRCLGVDVMDWCSPAQAFNILHINQSNVFLVNSLNTFEIKEAIVKMISWSEVLKECNVQNREARDTMPSDRKAGGRGNEGREEREGGREDL